VYNFNVPTFGKGVVYDVDQKVRTEQFRFFTEALKKDRLKKYVPMFAAEAEVSRTAKCRLQQHLVTPLLLRGWQRHISN
jgi:cytochrome P450